MTIYNYCSVSLLEYNLNNSRNVYAVLKNRTNLGGKTASLET